MQKVYKLFCLFIIVQQIVGFSTVSAENKVTQANIDSISLQHYLLGNWDEVIRIGELAKENEIDFKWLQQRIGYAYFNKKQYYKSMQHYEKALAFDGKDEITHLYLYYNGINTGDRAYARYHVGKLSDESILYIEQQQYRPFDALDVEFSYKMPAYEKIHNARYKRVGLNSMIGYQLNLYQTFSGFDQSTDSTQTTQDEYFALVGWNPFAKTNLSIGYHYVRTQVVVGTDNYDYPGNIIFGKISQKFNRVDGSISGAGFQNDYIETKQLGIHMGIGFFAKNNIRLTSSYYRVMETSSYGDDSRNIFKHTASMFLSKRILTEGSVSTGNLNYFIDNNGLYIYNALDPTTFRTGLSAFGFVNKALTLYINYTFDEKLILSNKIRYNQHSITGGIIWKL